MSPNEARSWENSEAHVELRGSYTQLCGTCVLKEELTTGPKAGIQLYGDYLPLKAGIFHFGPYASVSYVGQVGKAAGGLAMTLHPEDSSWEFFTQTGIRYTTDSVHYQFEGHRGMQGRGAFNLALGVRWFLNQDWYLSVLGEHDSNGRDVGIEVFPRNDNYNPGIDSLMFGVGYRF